MAEISLIASALATARAEIINSIVKRARGHGLANVIETVITPNILISRRVLLLDQKTGYIIDVNNSDANTTLVVFERLDFDVPFILVVLDESGDDGVDYQPKAISDRYATLNGLRPET